MERILKIPIALHSTDEKTKSYVDGVVCSGCLNKIPQAEGFDHRNSFSHSSGGWKPKIQVSAGLVSSEAPSLLGLQTASQLLPASSVGLFCM